VTAPARSFPIPARPGLQVLVGAREARSPRVGAWLLLTVTVLAAFFLLIYSRIALDRSAFDLQEIERQMSAQESRYWDLRLQVADLQAPERIVERAAQMGMVYPTDVETIEVAGTMAPQGETEDRWVDLKALLSAQP
jgi:cell division protein FtsL